MLESTLGCGSALQAIGATNIPRTATIDTPITRHELVSSYSRAILQNRPVNISDVQSCYVEKAPVVLEHFPPVSRFSCNVSVYGENHALQFGADMVLQSNKRTAFEKGGVPVFQPVATPATAAATVGTALHYPQLAAIPGLQASYVPVTFPVATLLARVGVDAGMPSPLTHSAPAPAPAPSNALSVAYYGERGQKRDDDHDRHWPVIHRTYRLHLPSCYCTHTLARSLSCCRIEYCQLLYPQRTPGFFRSFALLPFSSSFSSGALTSSCVGSSVRR
ncbi:unnamed protein product [Soboliphyme baturini]|uniref:Uncharacterized protein n=1 Tax=Soboliphyme baturini TaxID=241478 RepID=A0A183IRB5_9BILA|nr:unnamed protein product [Soboliphyme baturini]